MSDIFDLMAEKAGCKKGESTDEHRYGLAGDLKKTQYILELIGCPSDADTLKCVITAAEQGMEMDCYSMVTDAVDNMDGLITEISPFSITPCVKELDFVTCGGDAITAFADSRGLGYALTPRNAALAAMQNYWVDIAISNVAPHINQIVDEVINKKYADPSYTPNEQVIKDNCEHLKVFFDALDQQLESNKYIACDKYTWADVHWTAYIHLCDVAGCNELIDNHKNIKEWFGRIKTRKSQCGQNVVAYDVLPNAGEIREGRLKHVRISDF